MCDSSVFIKMLVNERSLTVITQNVTLLIATLLYLTPTPLTLALFLEGFPSIFEQGFRSRWYREGTLYAMQKQMCLFLGFDWDS